MTSSPTRSGHASGDQAETSVKEPGAARQRWVPLLITVVVAGLLVWRGRLVAAVALVLAAGVLTFVPAIGQPVNRIVRRATRVVSHWLGLVLFGLIDLVVMTPAWALNRVFHRDPLRRRSSLDGTTFEAPGSDQGAAEDRRTFLRERPAPSGSRARRVLRAVPRVIGVLVLLVALDFGGGWLWDATKGRSDPGVGDRILVVHSLAQLKGVKTIYDPRQDLPTMRNVPWWKDYLRELQLTPSTFYPYLQYKPIAFNGHYIHINGDWGRRSYEPAVPAGTNIPTIWMFGGSTGFGEGQRDEYTIPSDLARMADADGIPIRVVNYGQRGWVNWQEMLLYEQLLATGQRPDLAVFYDGLNDKNVQVQKPLGQPSFYDLDNLAKKATDQSDSAVETPLQVLRSAWHLYVRHSLVDKAVSKTEDLFGTEPARAASPPTADPEACYVGSNQVTPKTCIPTATAVRDTLAVYDRGRSVIQLLSRRDGVTPVFFWQPQRGTEPVYEELSHRVGPPTVDIADALDGHQDAYIDGGHTNEEGARLVAEAEWRTLKPKIEDWYAAAPASGVIGPTGRAFGFELRP